MGCFKAVQCEFFTHLQVKITLQMRNFVIKPGACTMIVDEQIQSYRIRFELTQPNPSNLALLGTMKLS